MRQTSLSDQQWMLSLLFSLIILLILSVSYSQAYFYPKKYLNTSLLEIELEGEVKYPGTYKVYPGTSLGFVLKKAGLTEKSDLRSFNFSDSLSSNKKLRVPLLKEIAVVLKAENFEKVIYLKPGSRVSALKAFIPIEASYDLSFLRSKKKLIDGQVFYLKLCKKS